MLQNAPREHSAILSTFIKLPFIIKIFVLSIFEWPFYTGFTVQRHQYKLSSQLLAVNSSFWRHFKNGQLILKFDSRLTLKFYGQLTLKFYGQLTLKFDDQLTLKFYS